jgi:hypothetical protein
MSLVSDSDDGRYLAQARLPSNSGRKSVQLRLREIDRANDAQVLLVEVVAKGEMFERGKRRGHGLVTDFEWRFPQILISSKALGELHASVRRSLDQIEPFSVRLGMGECVLDLELGHRSDVSARRDLPAFTVVCGVAASHAECAFAVDPSCLLELAEGLERMAALMR